MAAAGRKPAAARRVRPDGPGTETTISDIAYTSNVTIERERGPMRTATVPGNDQPVRFGVHGAVAEHYGVAPDDYPPTATTLDYVVAAAGG